MVGGLQQSDMWKVGGCGGGPVEWRFDGETVTDVNLVFQGVVCGLGLRLVKYLQPCDNVYCLLLDIIITDFVFLF